MKKIILFLTILLSLSLHAQKTLNEVFANCLISDTESNIARANPIHIIEIDEENNRIKTNYTQLENLLVKATGNESWFITQSEEASTIVEIKNVDIKTGWITLGETFSGVFNMDEGETLEFFNPFTNYKIIGNNPLFKPIQHTLKTNTSIIFKPVESSKEQRTITYC
ncbi:hypothetical protein KAOT1_12432 [Kordia algicida OT-1]|uniref:Uncharacterized protein n=1 Tax=Kordia algicida OT-1 TaxID=391587 RepID=A9DJ38_9FLAO|nr:hypothetical protein [Kordia algicida]EDP98022.1 hypothetical protein KAOT1_12432 [Kordia algicida OT-1]